MPQIIFIDAETYYDKEYTLRKMTAIEYVLDNRFECHGMAVQLGRKGTPRWIAGHAIQDWLVKVKETYGDEAVFVSHNALFDMLILAWRYNYVPPKMLDTLGMARALLGWKLKSLSLDSVSQYLGFGAKGLTVAKTMGLHTREMSRELYTELAAYCCDDCNKCARIFYHLVEQFPASEVPIMDMVLRACVTPRFKLDRDVLEKHLLKTLKLKREALELSEAGDASILRSNDKFAGLLKKLGVEPPTKRSPTTGEMTWAFAKTDSEFIDLAEHEDPKVQALVAARLGHKSTLEETRTQRLLAISNCRWPVGECWMPIPLRYGGAHTHRLSGDMKLNMQNLPRKSPLRQALVAPKGYQVVSIDLSQIEARIVAWLAEQLDLIEAFAMGEDIYSEFAHEVFKIEVSRTVNPDYRFIGKTAILGLGYNMSWMKFQLTVKAQSKNQLGKVIVLKDDVAQKVIDVYRRKYDKIRDLWTTLQGSGMMALANDGLYVLGPCEFHKHEIRLPNGMKLHYHNLQQTLPQNGRVQWVFHYGERLKLLFGGKILENVTQALARIVIMDTAVRVHPKVGRFAHQVHDELLYVVRNRDVDRVVEDLLAAAKVRPIWAPELPLASEAKFGPDYGTLKAVA